MVDHAQAGEREAELQQAGSVQEKVPAPDTSGATSFHLRQELARYLQNLQGLVSQADGNLLIEFPKTFSAQVYLLMESRKRRGLGTIITDETPPSPDKKCARDRLADSEADTEKPERKEEAQTLEMVAKGMKRIAALDDALRERQLEQLMVSRETFPDKWSDLERDRLKKHGDKVDAMLAKQRQEHARKRALKLKLLTVGHDIDETGADSIKSLLDRGFHLKEHEEVLLEMILNRGEQDEENDPFDPYLMALEESQRDDSTVVSQSMEELDNRLMDFALDHDWDDCNSMNDMSTLKYSSVHKRIPGLAQLSRRLRLSESNHSSAPTAQGMSTQGRSHRLSAISEEVSLVGSASGCCTFPASGSTANGGTSRSRSQAGDGKGSKQQVDYLRQMRDRRDLEQLRSKVDQELRSVREAEHIKPDEAAIKLVVEQCRRQQELHDERVGSGVSVCEWLRAPSLYGASSYSARPTMQGAVSLAGPADAHLD